jgi:hypothetical protein
MIVLTADQRNSRATADAAGPTLARIEARWSARLHLPAERTAGDEIQMLVDSAATALEITLDLTRSGRWSVGIGVGTVRLPLGSHVRESAGAAFIAARDAVDRAKKSLTHCAVSAEPGHPLASDAESLIDLLLLLRARRTPEGWELQELLSSGLTQAEAAASLGITPQSASQRARVAGLRVEEAATVALANLLERLDAEVTAPGEAH